jgi:hypothetical protein
MRFKETEFQVIQNGSALRINIVDVLIGIMGREETAARRQAAAAAPVLDGAFKHSGIIGQAFSTPGFAPKDRRHGCKFSYSFDIRNVEVQNNCAWAGPDYEQESCGSPSQAL